MEQLLLIALTFMAIITVWKVSETCLKYKRQIELFNAWRNATSAATVVLSPQRITWYSHGNAQTIPDNFNGPWMSPINHGNHGINPISLTNRIHGQMEINHGNQFINPVPLTNRIQDETETNHNINSTPSPTEILTKKTRRRTRVSKK